MLHDNKYVSKMLALYSALSKDQHQAEISQTCFNISKELLQGSVEAGALKLVRTGTHSDLF